MSEATRTYLTPRGLCEGAVAVAAVAAGRARPLCGAARAFTLLERTRPHPDGRREAEIVPADGTAPNALSAARPAFAGLELGRARLLGVVNVTPDSFSDGGRFADTGAAVAHGLAMRDAGADILDIGGESTRPGAAPIDPDEERRRVLPVVRALAEAGALVSIDTRHAATMAAAIDAGARIVNDVTALADPAARRLVASRGVAAILMHMQGEPRTMQADPRYVWAPGDIFDVLAARIAAAREAGIAADRIAVDPGIGFGQNDLHVAQVLDHLALFHGLGCPVVVGASRKGFIGRWSRGEPPGARLAGSVAVALHAARHGVQFLRVHDVAETRQAFAIAERVASAG
ncbi:MAG: dihydropteroate synthase [Rhodospirillaceae bacterium]|nr:dihydropteroate synthase [Rhodospirillaceae bacterium]